MEGTGHCWRGLKAMIGCFSLRDNYHQLKSHRGSKLDSLDGMRVISCMLVIFIHQWIFIDWEWYSNTEYLVELPNSHSIASFIVYSSLVMDVFFFLTTFLLTWKLYNKSENTSALDILEMIIMRILRLSPVMWFTLLASFALPAFGSGPLWVHATVDSNRQCFENWQSLVFLTSFLEDRGELCLSATWFLSTDMLLYVEIIFIVLIIKK
jgi:peptidoglycan/LPS O-acetylase OafA/YrhL